MDTVRIATVDDIDALVRLAVSFRDYLLRATPTAEQFRDGFAQLVRDPAAEFGIAVASSRSIGYVQIRFRRSAWNVPSEAEIEDLFVEPSTRRRGWGRRLVEFGLSRARARGCSVVGLTTNERNLTALDLYERLGFSAQRERWDGGRQLWLDREIGD